MRVIRLFYSGSLNTGTQIQLNSQTSTHLIRVLRTKVNTPVVLFNGLGNEYQCQMIDTDPRKTGIKVLTETQVNKESPLKITLLQGISRKDRMELCIQKSTELGAFKIIPVICERSNIKQDKSQLDKKQQHWQQVAISACEQSGRCTIPDIAPIQTLDDYLQQETSNANDEPSKIFLDPNATQTMKTLGASLKDDSIIMFIGPEGGLSENELTNLKHHCWTGVQLGPRILRTETAGPAVIAALQLLYGDF